MPRIELIKPSTIPSRLPDVHFACKPNCAVCCNGAPSMTLVEALRLSDEFTFEAMLSVYVQPQPKGPNFDELNTQFQRALATGDVLQMGPEPEPLFRYAFTIDVIALDLNHNGRCPKVTEGNRCGVYAKRPTMCQTVPVCTSVTERRNHADIVQKIRPNLPCNWSSSAPLLMKDGKIVNDGVARALRKSVDEQKHNGGIINEAFGSGELTSYAHLALISPGLMAHIPVDMNSIVLEVYRLRHQAAKKPESKRDPSEKFWLSAEMPAPMAYFSTQRERLQRLVMKLNENPKLLQNRDMTLDIRARNYYVMLNGLIDLIERKQIEIE